MPTMLRSTDIRGVMALPPTPVLQGADPFGDDSTVDLDEMARLVGQLIDDGVSSIGLCGTTGECASLSWDEKQGLYSCVRDVVGGRVPVFAGTTALGTREVVQQMRFVRDIGLDGAFAGLPLWQTPTVDEAVGFHRDIGEAVPDLPVLVYANRFFFKFDYPLEFWEGVIAECPTVVACKVGFPFTQEIFDVAGAQVNFMHGEGGTLSQAWRSVPESVTAAWATSCAMGPQPWVAALAAIERGDHVEAERLLDAIDAVPLPIPDFADFAKFNIQLEKTRIDAAGYTRCGPPRPPYRHIPDDWRRASEVNGEAWADLCRQVAAEGARS